LYTEFITKLSQADYEAVLARHSDLSQLPDSLNNRAYLTNSYEMKYKQIAATFGTMTETSKLDEIVEETQFDGKEPSAKKRDAIKEFIKKEEEKDKKEQLIYFYERSLIIMCRYSDYWIRYLHFLEKDESTSNKVDEISKKYEKLFARITNGLSVSQYYADFKEKHNDLEAARAVYQSMAKLFPSVEPLLLQLFFETRTKINDNFTKLFESSLPNVKDPEAVAFLVSEISEIVIRLDVTKPIIDSLNKHIEQLEYSRSLLLARVALLKQAKSPWSDIYQVFNKGFDQCKSIIEYEELWKILLFTCRSYCDIATITEVESKYFNRVDASENVNYQIKKKRKFEFSTAESNTNDLDQVKKQIKTA